MPWRQIYTLNVDDLSEKVLESHQRLRRIRSVSASAGRVPSSTPDYINVMHVNGSLDDVPKRITFSRSQYASRSSTDSFYSSLRQELIARPVVFLGSSLDEGPLWQHLSMRGSKHRQGISTTKLFGDTVLTQDQTSAAKSIQHSLATLHCGRVCGVAIAEDGESKGGGIGILKNAPRAAEVWRCRDTTDQRHRRRDKGTHGISFRCRASMG